VHLGQNASAARYCEPSCGSNQFVRGVWHWPPPPLFFITCLIPPPLARCVVVAAWCVGKESAKILPTHPSERVGFIIYPLSNDFGTGAGKISESWAN